MCLTSEVHAVLTEGTNVLCVQLLHKIRSLRKIPGSKNELHERSSQTIQEETRELLERRCSKSLVWNEWWVDDLLMEVR